MSANVPHGGKRLRRYLPIAVAALAGIAAATMVSIAVAKTFALDIGKNASVTDMSTGQTRHENIVVNSRGFAVYWLSGDSARHPECTKSNGCLAIWPAVTVSSAKRVSKAPGIKGKLGTWHRDGFTQVTLGGHPLYTFAEDTAKDNAKGEGIKHFGGTWSVIKTSRDSNSGMTSPTITTSTTPAYGY